MADFENIFNTFRPKVYKPQERETRSVVYPPSDDPIYKMSREEIAAALKPVLLSVLVDKFEPHEKFDARAKAIPVIDKYLYDAPLDLLTQKFVLARDGKPYWSDEELKDIHVKYGGEGPEGNRMDNSSMALHAEEERLLSAANRLKTKSNDTNLEDFIRGDCRIEDGKDKEAVVNRVISRLNKTESGHSSGAMGKGHDPNKRYKRISDIIKSMRAF